MTANRPRRKRILLIILIIPGILILAVLGFFLFAVITDYRPHPVTALEPAGNPVLEQAYPGQVYHITTFNIGYCGLDASQDFFMDGGTRARAGSEETVETNLKENLASLGLLESDFYLLQEVDERAKRSYYVDQRSAFTDAFGDYESVYAVNYQVPFVPLPLYAPMGGVNSGIMTFSAIQTLGSERIAFEGQEPFPVSLFELDRCFTETRIPVSGTRRQLVIINAHFSAYDTGGRIRDKQMEQMKAVIDREYESGNYIILGGDFNHQLPKTNPYRFEWEGEYPDWCIKMDEDAFPPFMEWAVDPAYPTCRALDAPYRPGVNFVVSLDGFLVSDNIKILKTFVTDSGFAYSDHQPVTLQFELTA